MGLTKRRDIFIFKRADLVCKGLKTNLLGMIQSYSQAKIKLFILTVFIPEKRPMYPTPMKMYKIFSKLASSILTHHVLVNEVSMKDTD